MILICIKSMSLPLIGLLFVLLLFCYYVYLDRVVGVLRIMNTIILLIFEIFLQYRFTTSCLNDQLSINLIVFRFHTLICFLKWKLIFKKGSVIVKVHTLQNYFVIVAVKKLLFKHFIIVFALWKKNGFCWMLNVRISILNIPAINCFAFQPMFWSITIELYFEYLEFVK